ncbi:MAG: amino acid permease [Candidatus Lokiarchaeota archaeon]|nr:amino acid permease [Candidatus Lokiarchaeota archaeon]
MKETKTILPKRTLSVTQGILYGIGCGVGGSIFILLGTAIGMAGPGVLISLILCGVLVLFTALNYSELSTSLPISGGSYSLGKEALGGFSAFIIGFFLWIANITTITFSALALSTFFFQVFFPGLTPVIVPIAIFAILFTTLFVFRTQMMAIKTLIRLTIILLALFLVFVIVGLFISPITNNTNYNPDYLLSIMPILGIIQSFSILFICFTSMITNMAYLSNDLKNPSRSIPKVNIYAILITLGIYLLMTIAVLINIGGSSSKYGDSPVLLAEVLFDIIGPFGFYIMGIGAVISTLIAMNAAMGSAVSIFTALARDNYIPKQFTKVSKKTGVPTSSLFITSIIAILFAIFININIAAQMTSFIYFFGLAFVNFAAVRLRYKRRELDRPYKAPFFPYLPIIVGIFCLILAFALSVIAIVLGIIVAIACISIYLLIFADRPSIILTLAGIKCFSIILLGILIWIVNNTGIVSSTIPGLAQGFTFILMRIVIALGVFAIITVILDVIPLREFVFFFAKKIDKKSIAINLGRAAIVTLDDSKRKIIHRIDVVIGVLEMIASIFIFTVIIPLLSLNIISIESINLSSTVIPQGISEFIFLSGLILFGACLFLSGLIFTYLRIEERSLGI